MMIKIIKMWKLTEGEGKLDSCCWRNFMMFFFAMINFVLKPQEKPFLMICVLVPSVFMLMILCVAILLLF